VLGILATSVSVIAILFHNYFFAILVLVAAFTLSLLAKRIPRIVTFTLTSQGLIAGTENYPWSIIATFNIKHNTSNSSVLLIDTIKILAPHLSIPIPNHKAEEIRTFLSEYIKEEELHEPLSNKVIEFFGL